MTIKCILKPNDSLTDATEKTAASLPARLPELLNNAGLPAPAVQGYLNWLTNEGSQLLPPLNGFFNKPEAVTFVPLFIYNENENTMVTILADKQFLPPEPGEQGSILAYVRTHGYDDRYLYSDCFGQLSCSSCAVEVLAGKPENPVPRDEEFDMLDIDLAKPPTPCTRLSCQTRVGSEALVLKIRKPCGDFKGAEPL